MRADRHIIGWVTLIQVFLIRSSNIFISYITRIVVNEKHFKTSFSQFRPFTKIIDFDHAKFPESISYKDVVWRKFIEIDTNRIFSKNEVLQERKLSYPFQSIRYNNVVVRKQIYFSPTFLKSWVHISDDIACAEGGSQCKDRYRDLPLSNS